MSKPHKKKRIARQQGKGTAKAARGHKIEWALLLVFGVIAAGVVYLCIDRSGQGSFSSSPVETETAVSDPGGRTVLLPESLFADGKARHFGYKTADGNTVRYFILKSSDGVIRVAFDACDVCWPEKKGYYQDGDYMVCRNCGRRFPSTKVNVVTGGCNPAPLERQIRDGNVVIQTRHIVEGKRFFG